MTLFQRTADQSRPVEKKSNTPIKIVRVLSVSLLMFSVSLVSQEARGCDLCELSPCWFDDGVIFKSPDLEVWDDEMDETILRNDFSVLGKSSRRDSKMLVDLIEFASQEGMSFEDVLFDYIEFRERSSRKVRRSPKQSRSRIIARPSGYLNGARGERDSNVNLKIEGQIGK